MSALTVISHLVLAGTGAYCLSIVGAKVLDYSQASFGSLVIHGIVGVLKFALNSDNTISKIHEATFVLEHCLALPCITTLTIMSCGYMKEIAIANAVFGIVPFILYIIDKNWRESLDLITLVDAVALGVLCGLNENWIGVGAAVTYAVNYFTVSKKSGDILDTIPYTDMYNFFLAIYAYLALQSLSG